MPPRLQGPRAFSSNACVTATFCSLLANKKGANGTVECDADTRAWSFEGCGPCLAAWRLQRRCMSPWESWPRKGERGRRLDRCFDARLGLRRHFGCAPCRSSQPACCAHAWQSRRAPLRAFALRVSRKRLPPAAAFPCKTWTKYALSARREDRRRLICRAGCISRASLEVLSPEGGQTERAGYAV